ncbi:MAG TPA: hypothetical protein PLY68_06550 [Myxococcota bacterium]|nr:hypothetical protein [Myxococcota bacterium]HQP95842.1 hypothetical protein [Myxococcota bacterium]
MSSSRSLLVFAAFLTLLSACADGPTGLAPTPDGDGPRVLWSAETADGLIGMPFPNDFLTRREPTSPTGLRVNLPITTRTKAEEKLLRLMDWMDGFGISSPITVSFSDDIDIVDLKARQAGNHDYDDDAILLINISPESENFGKPVPLDVGQGNFPLALTWPWQYWDFDPHADSGNLMFETHDEDKNNNGELDKYEDIDFDGVLDRPNTFSGANPGLNNPDDLISFYEKETRTLVLWPVVPMDPGSRYAVVITDRMKGLNGEPVVSPFPYVNEVNQTPDLERLADVLPGATFGMSLDNIAFAWTFTTQTIHEEMVAIRDGIYGAGPLDWLSSDFPVDLKPDRIWEKDAEGKQAPADAHYVLPNDAVLSLIDMVGGILYKPTMVAGLKVDTAHVDYWVLGEFTAPNFLVDRDGVATEMYPADDNESFFIDLPTNDAVVGPGKVTFMCAVPKETEQFKAPFPVMFYGHGFSSAVFEMFGFAGRMAQHGHAMCAIDFPGHGLALPVEKTTDWPTLINDLLDSAFPQLKPFYAALVNGRIRDLDNDGFIASFDNGGDLWGWDVFHTRDMIRQGAVDHMQFIRNLRSLGEVKWDFDVNGNGQPDDLMGDFNGDGRVDMGTAKNVDYPVWGQSMGAFNAMVLAGVEPCVAATAPISGAGGMIQAGLRTNNPGTPEGALLPLMGPFMVFTPAGDGTIEIAWLINDQHKEYFKPEAGKDRDPNRPHYYPFARTNAIGPGDTVIITNTVNGEVRRTFRMPLPADATSNTDCDNDATCLAEKARCQLDPANWTEPECVKWRGWRVAVPADALSAVEKRPYLGLKDGDTQPVPVTCVQPDASTAAWHVEKDSNDKPFGNAICNGTNESRSTLFGDTIVIDIYDGWVDDLTGVEPAETIDTFELEITFQGAVYPIGTPLVSIATGLGYPRNTPGFRQLISMASAIMERGDSIAYVPGFAHRERISCGCGYDEGTCPGGECRNPVANAIIYHSVGDPNVPISTGLNLGRASGAIQYEGAEVTANDLLLGAWVAEGVEGFRRHLSSGENMVTYADWDDSEIIKDMRWPDEFATELVSDPEGAMPLHADPDNADRGVNEFGEPDVPGYIPQTRILKDGAGNPIGHIAFRIPYNYPLGAHGVEFSDPRREFNINNFIENQLALFMATGGRVLSDNQCMASGACDFLPQSIQDDSAVHMKKK